MLMRFCPMLFMPNRSAFIALCPYLIMCAVSPSVDLQSICFFIFFSLFEKAWIERVFIGIYALSFRLRCRLAIKAAWEGVSSLRLVGNLNARRARHVRRYSAPVNSDNGRAARSLIMSMLNIQKCYLQTAANVKCMIS